MSNLSNSFGPHKRPLSDEGRLNRLPVIEYLTGRNDKEVWASFLKGSEEAFADIYQNHFESLVRLGNQFSLSNELIRDAIQDFFIDLRERRSNLSNIECIKLYLIKSFRRRLLDLKKKQEKRQTRLNDFYKIHFTHTPSTEKLISDSELEAEEVLRLNKAIQQLTVNQREAIYYLYFENMSYKEIQQVMNMKYVRSVRNLIYKALDRLRDQYSS